MNIANVLTASAERDPRKAAIVLENESISYGELDRATTSLARWLLRQGLKPGDRIAIHWPNSIETVKLFFACFKAGMIAVPINVRMKSPEVAYVLKHSHGPAVIYKAITVNRPRTRYSVVPKTLEAWLLSKVFPTRFIDQIMAKQFELASIRQ